MPRPTANLEKFAQMVATATGLDVNVVRAWAAIESGYGSYKGSYEPGARRAFNYLNYGVYGGSKHRQGFDSMQQAVDQVAKAIKTSKHYGGIRAAIGKSPKEQLAAIAKSPWAASHYNNGRDLATTYAAITGIPVDLSGSVDAGSSTPTGKAGAVVGGTVGGAVTVMSAITAEDVNTVYRTLMGREPTREEMGRYAPDASYEDESLVEEQAIATTRLTQPAARLGLNKKQKERDFGPIQSIEQELA